MIKTNRITRSFLAAALVVAAQLANADAIAAVPTGNHGFHQDVPKEPVLITRVYVEE